MDEDQKIKYSELGTSMRTYINLRFAQLTLFLVIIAGLIRGLVEIETDNNSPEWISWAIILGGLFTTIIFMIIEHSSADYFHYYKRLAGCLEEGQAITPYSGNVSGDPKSKWGRWLTQHTTATGAVRWFFGGFLLIWVMLIADKCYPFLPRYIGGVN